MASEKGMFDYPELLKGYPGQHEQAVKLLHYFQRLQFALFKKMIQPNIDESEKKRIFYILDTILFEEFIKLQNLLRVVKKSQQSEIEAFIEEKELIIRKEIERQREFAINFEEFIREQKKRIQENIAKIEMQLSQEISKIAQLYKELRSLVLDYFDNLLDPKDPSIEIKELGINIKFNDVIRYLRDDIATRLDRKEINVDQIFVEMDRGVKKYVHSLSDDFIKLPEAIQDEYLNKLNTGIHSRNINNNSYFQVKNKIVEIMSNTPVGELEAEKLQVLVTVLNNFSAQANVLSPEEVLSPNNPMPNKVNIGSVNNENFNETKISPLNANKSYDSFQIQEKLKQVQSQQNNMDSITEENPAVDTLNDNPIKDETKNFDEPESVVSENKFEIDNKEQPAISEPKNNITEVKDNPQIPKNDDKIIQADKEQTPAVSSTAPVAGARKKRVRRFSADDPTTTVSTQNTPNPQADIKTQQFNIELKLNSALENHEKTITQDQNKLETSFKNSVLENEKVSPTNFFNKSKKVLRDISPEDRNEQKSTFKK